MSSPTQSTDSSTSVAETNNAVFPIPDDGVFQVVELNEEDPTKYIIGLIQGATKTIRFSTALSDFYTKKEVTEAFKQVLQNGVKVQLLLEQGVYYPERKATLSNFFDIFSSENLEVRQVEYPTILPHWLFIDDNHIRIEKEHKYNELKTSNGIFYHTESVTNESAKSLILALRNNFKKWWDNSRPL